MYTIDGGASWERSWPWARWGRPCHCCRCRSTTRWPCSAWATGRGAAGRWWCGTRISPSRPRAPSGCRSLAGWSADEADALQRNQWQPVTSLVTSSRSEHVLAKHRHTDRDSPTSQTGNTFRNFRSRYTSRRRREMYIGHSRLQYVCLCVFLSLAASLQYCTHPDVTWRNDRGAL